MLGMIACLSACACIMFMCKAILHVKRVSSASPFLGVQRPLSDCFIVHLYSYFTRHHVIRMHAHVHTVVYHVLAHVCTAGRLNEAAWSAGGLLCAGTATRSKSGGLRLLHFIHHSSILP